MLTLAMFLLVFPVLHEIGNTALADRVRFSIPARSVPDTCLAENELSNELRKLSTANSYEEQAQVVNLLKKEAGKSALCRKRVISVLVQAMDKPNLDLARDRPSFYLWHYGSEVLADLRAVEAMDLLIAHLDLNDGTTFPLNHYPAMVAVVRIGKIALPKLHAALRETADPKIRRHVVFCIAWTGGPSAKQVLNEALAVEKDACVISFIRASLVALNNKQQPNQITSSDRLKWYAAFRCNS